MASKLNSYLGSIHLLANNPRTIRENAFNRLVESIERDPEFMMARGIVVWQVPDLLAVAEGEKNPFIGQEGKLVVLGGNQRCRAFMALGRKDLEDDWIVEAKDAEGVWWSVDKAERFVQIDNNPEGISGENDMKKMFDNFSRMSMEMAGIDFSEYDALMEAEVGEKSPEEKVEEGEYGEKSPELKEFIEHRERARKDLKEIDDTGFYLVLVFPDFETKAEFISKSGLTGNAGVVKVDVSEYVVLVFESYDQKVEFCEKAGLYDEPGEGDPGIIYDRFCDGVAFAEKMGIGLKASRLHFSDRKVDAGLAAMAMDDAKQKSEKEQEEGLFKQRKEEAAYRKAHPELEEEEDVEEEEPLEEDVDDSSGTTEEEDVTEEQADVEEDKAEEESVNKIKRGRPAKAKPRKRGRNANADEEGMYIA